jgi:superfamily I DNA/RNA helicase
VVRCGSYSDRYDAVLIDEAQNLDFNSLRLLVELTKEVKGRRKLILAGDMDQSVYGVGVSWGRVHPDLNMRKRNMTVDANYRCSRQIFLASRSYLGECEIETNRPPRNTKVQSEGGVQPTVVFVQSVANEDASVSSYVQRVMGNQESLDSCAVLVPTNRRAHALAATLNKMGIPTEYVHKEAAAIPTANLRIMTRHSAAGLEFETVMLALACSSTVIDDSDDAAEERRVNYMAMTRAKRRLLVVTNLTDGDKRRQLYSLEYWHHKE